MTRTVFDTAMVAHVWAQGTQEEGRNPARRVFFDGPRLFSYGSHFLTGYRLPDGAAFLNSGRYSVSTSRHQSDARHAIRGRGYAIPACLMNDGGRGYSNRFPLPDFMESRVFHVPQYVTRAGAVVDSPYDAEGNHIATGRAKPRPATAAELKKARADLLTLFLKAEETAPAESIVAAFRYAGAKPEEAAKAAARVTAAHEKRAKEEAAADLKRAKEGAASDAKAAAARPLSDFAAAVQEARADLKRHNYRGAWERAAADLLDKARRLFKARKEAKARGWIRIAADLKARESILRAGATGLEAYSVQCARATYWQERKARIRVAIAALADHEGAAAFGKSEGRGSLAYAWQQARQAAEALLEDVRGAALYPQGDESESFSAGLARAARLMGADLARMAEGLEALARAFREREEAAARAERAAALEKAAADLKAWREGNGRLPGRLSDTEGGALIRASGVQRDESGAIVGGSLDTSHGASVPLAHALRAFRFLKLCRDSGQAWQANGKTLPVGHFRIDSVDSSGNFRAGCHVINWTEVAALAARLGVLDLAPADTTESRPHA